MFHTYKKIALWSTPTISYFSCTCIYRLLSHQMKSLESKTFFLFCLYFSYAVFMLWKLYGCLFCYLWMKKTEENVIHFSNIKSLLQFSSQHKIAIFIFLNTWSKTLLLRKEARETDDQLKTLIIILILIKLNKVFHLIIERKSSSSSSIKRRIKQATFSLNFFYIAS